MRRRTAAWLLAGTALALAAAPLRAQVSVPLPRSNGAPLAPVSPASPPIPVQQRPGTSVALPGEASSPPAIPLNAEGRPDINPYDRDVELTVPLTYRDHPLGEVPMVLTKDDRFFVSTKPFLTLIDTLLNPAARARIAQALGERAQFGPDDLGPTGVSLQYDPSALSVVVLRISATDRATEELFPKPVNDEGPVDLQPADVSAYLNANIVESRLWGGVRPGFLKPSIYVNGAARVGPIVFEGDVQYVDQNPLGLSGTGYRFDRNYARFVYDQPEEYRRWYLGDLTPEIRAQQTFVQIGGVGVSRQRRRFDQFRSAVLQGNRQLVLQRDSTIDVYRNGALFKEFQLEAGAYDLSSLPLATGSNDIRIQVRDNSGFVQDLNYQSYLDPIDLMPGDYEYAAYIGKVSRTFGLTPRYDGGLAFSGFYRKAFVNAPAVGIGVQVDRNNQILTGQTQVVLPNGSRLIAEGGASRSSRRGGGYTIGLGYDQVITRFDLADSASFQINYTSKRFTGLGYDDPNNSSVIQANGQYTRALNPTTTLLFGGTYLKSRRADSDTYRLYVNTNYRFSRSWSVRGGVDYTRFGRAFQNRGGPGFTVSLVFQPTYRDRAEATHDSSTETSQLSYIHASSNEIGSIGYGAIAGRAFSDFNAQAFADYTGNRFDASFSHSAYGRSFANITDQQISTVRLGTSFAFADGHFGVGRRVNDSFAILYPHPTLKGHDVVAGQSIAQNEYFSKSGALGGAVNNFLTSYVTQSIQYDVENPPPGYDIGPGVVRVKPPYRSGYALEVGTDAFVSAVGNLVLPDGKPAALASGRVIDLDRPNDAPLLFFTNSVGRFAMQNLRPSQRYRVELYGTPNSFDFTIPKTTDGLVDLQSIKLAPAN